MLFVWLIPLLPLLAAGLIAVRMLFGHDCGDAAERPTARIALDAMGGALLLLVALDALALLRGAPGHVHFGHWFASGAVSVPISLLLDRFALSMATLFALLIYLALRFSVNYLHREPGFHRFFFAMSLFGAGMMLIALSGNAVLTFCGWELAGLSSYLLIGYAYDRPTATGNALWAFVTNRIGDAAFVLGIALAFLWIGGAQWPDIVSGFQRDTFTAGLLAIGFVTAALVKSAQVPFSSWLARALEGPTPSSAVFYGAVMVHAGVFLLIRLEPLLAHIPVLMGLLVVAGLLTALYGFLTGLTQADVKSALIYGVMTQVGLMVLACGLGWFTLAAWYLALHALWRAYQFLSAPSYMQAVHRPPPPPPAWLATRQRLYTAALHRFWLDPLADALLIRPTRSLARDVRDLDDRVVSRLVGLPEESRASGARLAAKTGDDRVLFARGAPGRALEWIAQHLYRFEQRLLLQQGGGFRRHLEAVGHYLLALERLLEQPRYLLVIIMATLATIL